MVTWDKNEQGQLGTGGRAGDGRRISREEKKRGVCCLRKEVSKSEKMTGSGKEGDPQDRDGKNEGENIRKERYDKEQGSEKVCCKLP